MRDWNEAIKLYSAGHAMAAGQPRHGLVTSVDPVNHSVKITLEPDGIETGWIPDAGIAAGGLRIACPSEVGTQVLVASVEGDAEHLVVVARIFDTVITPPISPVTSQPVQPGEIGIFLADGTFLHMTSSGTHIGGNLTVSGSVRATQDIIGGAVSLTQHVHAQVQPGTGLSGPPAN